MKKLFTFFLALAASVGMMFASDTQVDGIWYDFDDSDQTASVTFKGVSSSENEYSGVVSIPSSVTYNAKTYSVTSIGTWAFYGCTGLTSVIIPNSVIGIGSEVFYGCTGLTSVTIPNGVTSIGQESFYGCTGLTSIIWNAKNCADFSYYPFDDIRTQITSFVFGDKVEHIPACLCKGMSKLTNITIPNSVTSIGSLAFNGCTSLTSIIIPNSVTSIGNSAFSYCTGLTSIEIPNSVTSIGNYVFYGCTGLTSVTIPNGVTSIGKEVFSDCAGLTSIIWNAKNCADAASADSASFYNVRSQITSFVLGDEVEHIPAFLCYGMSKLTNITIPNSVTSIGKEAFRNCTGLSSITIPNSVTSIGTYTFLSCYNLKKLVVQNKNVQIEGGVYSIFAGATALTYISAPACIFDIHSDYTSYPSYFSQKLDTIEVTNGVLSANAMWMINLSRKTLQSVDLSGTTQTDLADEAFKEFYNMQTLKLPDNLLHIGYKSLAECVKLQSINIPANVTKIDDRAFENCRSLKTITFGGQSAGAPGRFEAPAAASQLQTIGNWAFYNCHELQNLTIPEGVTEIGDGAFYGCTYLEDLTLPASVQSIGDNTFALCAKLQKIVVNASVPPTIQAKTFFDVKRQIPVYVPDDVVSQYENDTYWSEFDIQGISHMPQGIDDINAATKSQKIVRDNQVLILRGDKTYTLTGQEIK